ncbi:MAG: NAD(P)H-dependent oxidoreductase [Bacteroidota bacterium]
MTSKILIIMGSSRSDGNTRKIVDAIIKKTGADLINLNDYEISYFDYQNQNKSDDFIKIATKMMEYEHLIFATPIYWYAMSAQLKTFFDRLTDLLTIRKALGRQLRNNKKMYAVACSSDQVEYEGFFMPFEKTAAYLGMGYGGHLHTWVVVDKIPDELLFKIHKFCDFE